MVFRFMTFVFDEDDGFFQNNNPGSPLYYGPSDPSSSESSPALSVCNGCLGGSSVAQRSDSDADQRFSSPVQTQQSQNRSRRGGNNNFLLNLIYRRKRFTAYSLVPFNSPQLPISKYHSNRGGDNKAHDKHSTSTEPKNGSNWELKGKLVLFDNCSCHSWAFSLEDLLKADAEVLPESPWRRCKASLEDLLRASAEEFGEWSQWPTYKVSLKDSTTVVVVKRLRIGIVTREHMELLGQIRHENVASLRGYCISTDGTVVLYDYHSQGSVSSMMRGQRSSLDWEQRRKIVIGAVRGIAYIHNQNGGRLFHGNLTPFSVFINSQGYGCISDVYCDTSAAVELPYSYYSPNRIESSQASDIYGLGLLMLKLLFGYIPLTESTAGCMFLRPDCDQRNDIYKFDKGLPYSNCLQMLNLALSCVMNGPDNRPKIKQLVEEVENI